MAHRSGGSGGQQQRIIGEYTVTQQIGSGAFAVVWKARHKNGSEVAIKEIATEKLNPKLQESLLSEIAILKRTVHPNIIRLHDIVEAPNKIFLVLEFCTGGDLAAYINRHGRIDEASARTFMRQLGAGLQALRANNLIHRDLKPQNLLLSTNDASAVLKIADFGFARSLQPQGMAETICGSPLYMAPEILQRQKYDAKADLWSVGAILFQLLTAKPPFTGNSHLQLLQNIMKSTDLKFPEGVLAELHPDCLDLIRKLLRRNPLERLSFEEFFKHKFMGPMKPKAESGSPKKPPRRSADLTDQEFCFPFSLSLDDDCHSSPEAQSPVAGKPRSIPASPSSSPSYAPGRAVIKPSAGPLFTRGFRHIRDASGSIAEGPKTVFGFGDGANVRGSSPTVPTTITNTQASTNAPGTSPTTRLQRSQGSRGGLASEEDRLKVRDGFIAASPIAASKGGTMVDSMEYIEREYVLVGNMMPSTESLSISATSGAKAMGSAQKISISNIPVSPPKNSISSIPVSPTLITRAQSMPIGVQGSPLQDVFRPPLEAEQLLAGTSYDPASKLMSLEHWARVITELAIDKLEAEHLLESFEIQLVSLAIWKESLHVCHTWAAAAAEGNCQTDAKGAQEAAQEAAAANACSFVEREFSRAVDQAENVASHFKALDGSTEMPDAMELIYQAALAVGKTGAVDELLENFGTAAVAYAKAAALLYFLLLEAPSLPVNPPLILSAVDRQRLHQYAHAITVRQTHCTAHAECSQERPTSVIE